MESLKTTSILTKVKLDDNKNNLKNSETKIKKFVEKTSFQTNYHFERKTYLASTLAKSPVLISLIVGAFIVGVFQLFNANFTENKSTKLVLSNLAKQSPTLVNSTKNNSSINTQQLIVAKNVAKKRAEIQASKLKPMYSAPTVGGIITSFFGPRWGTNHNGIDIANPIGTPVFAIADGIVTDAGPASGFGLWVKIKHADGFTSLYGHINTINTNIGTKVYAGDLIATVGNRGQSTGPHLHLGILDPNGQEIDPFIKLIEYSVYIK